MGEGLQWLRLVRGHAAGAGCHALSSPSLAKGLKAAGVDRAPGGWDKTSDLAPMWVEVEV